MLISRRVFIMLMFSLYLWNAVIRYPIINGPHVADGFVLMRFAFVISNFGEIPWILDLSSYLGMYPFSEPMGIPVLLATINIISGIEVEIAALISGFLYAYLGLTFIAMTTNKE